MHGRASHEILMHRRSFGKPHRVYAASQRVAGPIIHCIYYHHTINNHASIRSVVIPRVLGMTRGPEIVSWVVGYDHWGRSPPWTV